MPIKPMLLSSKEEAFDSEDYIFEIKWDGYRCISFIEKSSIKLQSRNGHLLNRTFPELMEIYKAITGKKAILDGEICYLEQDGKANFSKLQARYGENNPSYNSSIKLIIWDILSYNDKDIYWLPLKERKAILQEIVKEGHGILIPGYIKKHGKKLYQEAAKNKLEGIVAKKLDSPYEFKRSKYWYKIKCWQYTEVLIGGFTEKEAGLLVGKYSNNQLHYLGKVKLALERELTEALFRFLPTLLTDSCPFSTRPVEGDIKWVKPLIRVMVRYTELSKHNTFRHGYVTKIILDNSQGG
jgi:DNA ligase D-like protein (predicted ligase)